MTADQIISYFEYKICYKNTSINVFCTFRHTDDMLIVHYLEEARLDHIISETYENCLKVYNAVLQFSRHYH